MKSSPAWVISIKPELRGPRIPLTHCRPDGHITCVGTRGRSTRSSNCSQRFGCRLPGCWGAVGGQESRGRSDRGHQSFRAFPDVRATSYDESNLMLNLTRYHGHPLACAAAYEVQQVVKRENLIANCREMGAYLGQLLQSRLESHKNVGNIRGRGLVWGVGNPVHLPWLCFAKVKTKQPDLTMSRLN